MIILTYSEHILIYIIIYCIYNDPFLSLLHGTVAWWEKANSDNKSLCHWSHLMPLQNQANTASYRYNIRTTKLQSSQLAVAVQVNGTANGSRATCHMSFLSNPSAAGWCHGRLIRSGTAVESNARVEPNAVSVFKPVYRNILYLFTCLWHYTLLVWWQSVFKGDEKAQEEETKRGSWSEWEWVCHKRWADKHTVAR